jgi:hypothetical protein
VGSIELLAHFTPNIAIFDDGMVVWGGQDLYWAKFPASTLNFNKLQDELLAIYSLDGRWCLLFETALELKSSDLVETLTRYDLDEIVLEFWWEGSHLKVEDLQGRRLVFNPVDQGLVPISGS